MGLAIRGFRKGCAVRARSAKREAVDSAIGGELWVEGGAEDLSLLHQDGFALEGGEHFEPLAQLGYPRGPNEDQRQRFAVPRPIRESFKTVELAAPGISRHRRL